MEKSATNKILVIIPCYNEEKNIPHLLTALKKVTIPNCHIEALVINDASTDSTLSVLQASGVNYLENIVNLGIGGTVQLGFRYAFENNFDIAVQMDGDNQHPPSELQKLIAPLLSGDVDVTIGSRFAGTESFRSTAARRAGINFFYYLNRFLTGIEIRDSTSGYRAFDKPAIAAAVRYYPDEYPEPEMIVYLTHLKFRLREVPVIMNERTAGISSINSMRAFYYMAKVSLNIIFLHMKLKYNG